MFSILQSYSLFDVGLRGSAQLTISAPSGADFWISHWVPAPVGSRSIASAGCCHSVSLTRFKLGTEDMNGYEGEYASAHMGQLRRIDLAKRSKVLSASICIQ